MTVANAAPPLDPAERPPLPVKRFTVEQYQRLGELGILSEEDRVELLEGWVVPAMVRSPEHDNAVELAEDALRAHLPSGVRLRVQSSIRTADSEPEPDLAIVRGTARERKGRHPGQDEVLLVVEVADTSLAKDRGPKARLYARAGIGVYWIVNLVDRQLEVHTDPSGPTREPRYRRTATFAGEDAVALELGGQPAGSIPVSALLP